MLLPIVVSTENIMQKKRGTKVMEFILTHDYKLSKFVWGG